ncbi:MAG: discoidin domain-containing protein, partial [Muribaculaceae bacterium]|nr:discoidin domain-containing protein [Muribaculaceae bacterium]
SRYESWSNQEAGATVTVNFDDTYVLEKVAIDFGGSTVIPVESKLQVTTDGAVWTDIEGSTFTTNSGIDGVVTVDCKNTPAKSVRMLIVSNRSAYLVIYEFDCFGKTVQIAERTISVSVNDTAMGTAYVGEEGTTTLEGQTGNVKMVAVANEGYEFVNWTLNGEVVSTDATIYDLTDGDKEYVANFVALATCNISVSVNDAVMGTATASLTGEMFKYTEVTFTATANEGYEFVRWTVDGVEVSKQNPFTTSVEEDADYQAIFRMPPTKIAIERGEVSMSPYGSHTADKMVDGQFNTYIDSSLSQGYESGDITATIVLEEESLVGDVKIYFAGNYRPTAAKIQVSTDYETWVDVEGSEFLGAEAEDASDVVSGAKSITVDCGGVTAKYVRMFVTQKAATYLTIYEFEAYEAPVNVEARTISVSVNDATMGSAYVGVEGTTSLEGQTSAVKLVATVSDNAYRFVNWTVDGEEVSTSTTFVDRTEGDKAYVANFEAKPIYEVSVSSISEMLGTVSSTAGEVVYEGDVVTFTATAVDGYKFAAWTNGTDTVSVTNPYTVTVTEAIAIVANFERDPKLDRSTWEISASSEETTGEGAGNGVATCIIDGKESTFWHSAWQNSSPAYPHWFMIDMKTSKAFDAFEYVSRGTSTASDGVNNGNIVNYTLYASDEPIDAEALENATLVKEGQFTYDGTTNVHKVEFNSIKARYVMLYATGVSANGGKHAACVEFYLYSSNYAVSVASADEAMGTVYIQEEGVTSVGCSVEGTDVVTITAVAAPKYQFVNWTLNGEVVSTEAVYTTDLVTESRAYIANFEFAPVAPRTITATVNNAAKGSVVFLAPESTESSVVSDNIVVAKAVPATTDEFFVNWTINGVEVGTEDTYEYLEEGDVTIQANFESRYVVTVAQVAGGTIYVKAEGNTIASGDRVLEGNNLTITVSENNRSELKKLF